MQRHCSTSRQCHRLTATVTSLMLRPAPLELGRAIIVIYIEFAWNYAGFNSNYFYFMRHTQLWKSPNYSNKSLNYSSVGDSWIPVHCGRNTHFRQICFAVPNFNFIYIYNIKKITWQPAYFLKKYAITGNQRKLRKWREQMHPICCYSSQNINCHSIQAARKKYANNIKRALDYYYYYLPFLYGNI